MGGITTEGTAINVNGNISRVWKTTVGVMQSLEGFMLQGRDCFGQ